ncbi:MAG: metallophosphoesterase [Phycisphaerales bacterium]|nr:metallophosphoesterase [Phycisphaerales bacterium]
MSRRIVVVGLVIWMVGAVVGSWVTIQSWVVGADGVVRLMGNFAWIVSLPGWVTAYVIHVLGFGGGQADVGSIVIANVIGWGYLVVGGIFVWRVRGVVAGKRIVVEGDEEPVDRSRRAFLTNSTFGGVAVVAAGAPGYATLVEPWSIQVREYSIPVEGLPESLRGLRIVQVADTHLGPRIPEWFVVQAYEMALGLRPDLVVLTGDHVHDGVKENRRAAELCRPLVEACSVLGVLGNHDWWGDGDGLSKMLSEVGVRMIDNDRVWVDPATRSVVEVDPGDGIALVGLGDLTDGVVNIGTAFRDVKPETARVVLAHNPDTAEIEGLTRVGSPRVDLMISGHTHGGQVRIPFLGTPIVPSLYGSKYAGGLVEGPAFAVLISRGVGMSMLPVRVGVPPEIGVITLV